MLITVINSHDAKCHDSLFYLITVTNVLRATLQMLTLSTDRFQRIQKEAPPEYQSYLVQVTKYQAAQNCKVQRYQYPSLVLYARLKMFSNASYVCHYPSPKFNDRMPVVMINITHSFITHHYSHTLDLFWYTTLEIDIMVYIILYSIIESQIKCTINFRVIWMVLTCLN